MTKTELETAKANFDARSKFIREATLDALTAKRETGAEQEKRIKMLLKPQNYTRFFDYYFLPSAPIRRISPLG